MYDVFVLEMYINYDKIIYNLIEKSVGSINILFILLYFVLLFISYSIYVVNINYCIIDESMELILKIVYIDICLCIY